MNKAELLASASKKVGRLIMQYHEYLEITKEIESLETQKLKTAAQICKQTNTSISAVLANQPTPLKAISEKLDLLKLDMQQTSDEMTFENPIVWMMYKHKAYLGKQNEIVNMRQFRAHCSPTGYICTKRYKFLASQLKSRYQIDLENDYPDDYLLSDFYSSDTLFSLSTNTSFMRQWKQSEYLKTNGQVNKWETAIEKK